MISRMIKSNLDYTCPQGVTIWVLRPPNRSMLLRYFWVWLHISPLWHHQVSSVAIKTGHRKDFKDTQPWGGGVREQPPNSSSHWPKIKINNNFLSKTMIFFCYTSYISSFLITKVLVSVATAMKKNTCKLAKICLLFSIFSWFFSFSPFLAGLRSGVGSLVNESHRRNVVKCAK